jgi:hypothetical protein
MECKKDANIGNCSCTYPGCERNGVCCDCVKYHRNRGELPACYFSETAESTYDRSIEHFIKETS